MDYKQFGGFATRMHSQHDPIPMLPPMPRRPRRRRSYKTWVALAALAVLGTATAIVLVISNRYHAMADEAYRQATDLFENAAYTKAERAYQLFRREHPKDERAKHAATIEDVCRLAQSLNDEHAKLDRLIAALDEFWSNRSNEPIASERWPTILSLAERRAKAAVDRAVRTLEVDDVAAADRWVAWLREQQTSRMTGSDTLAVADFERSLEQTRGQAAVEVRRRDFREAAEVAIAELSPAGFTAAFEKYDALRAGTTPPDRSLVELFERLRTALRGTIRFAPQPEPPGETAAPVPKLPLEAYTLLATRTRHKVVPSSPDANRPPVFARVKDLCFALDPATGEAHWVLRVGYDAGVPQLVSLRTKPAVLVPWFRAADPSMPQMLSLCEAATGEAIWSWQSPDSFVGPPAVTRDAVFAATADGIVWRLDLETGSPRGVLRLPEPLDGPPTPREDGRGLCLIGARQAVYLMDVGRDEPVCLDVVMLGRRSDTARCLAMWAQPYVVIFENDLVDRCYVRVLFSEPAGFRLVRELQLEGRLWQPPVLDGADVFLVTDRGRQYCFGLHPGDSAVNLYPLATAARPPDWRQPALPQFARADDPPFLAVSDSIYGLRVDRTRGMLTESWHRAPPSTAAVTTQPLQVSGGLFISAWQEPDRDGVLVQAHATPNGELAWETRLGCAAKDIATGERVEATRGSKSASVIELPAVVRSDAGMFALTRNDGSTGGWRSQPLALPIANSSIQYGPRSIDCLVYASDRGSRLRRVSVLDGAVAESAAISPPITSEICVDSLYEPPHGPSGRWAFFVTSEGSIEVRELFAKQSRVVHAARIPAVAPSSEPWRWSPLVIRIGGGGVHQGLNCVIVAHPSGIVCRAERRRTDDIDHLFVTECRKDLPPLAAPVLRMPNYPKPDNVLCVAADGRCLLLDSQTLRTVSEWRAPAAPRSVAGDDVFAYVLDATGTIQQLFVQEGTLQSVWSHQLGDGDWMVVSRRHKYDFCVFAVSATGRIEELHWKTGQSVWRYDSPTPLAVAPEWTGDELVLATIDGGVFFVPGPPNSQGGEVEPPARGDQP